jgi:hypothetical protein
MAERISLVAVISDLGSHDPLVAQFRCAALNVNPNLEIVDISHEVRPHDLLEAAFLLERTYRDFPTRTTFVVMVDQLLGVPRRPLLAVSMDYFYFAPDNGVLSYVYEHDSVSNVYHVTAEHYVKLPPGPLAAPRDTFGPAVGWLTKGIESANFGEAVQDHVKTPLPRAQRTSRNELKGMILCVDRYGSLVSNIHENDVNAVRHAVGPQEPFRAVIGDKSFPVVGGWAEGMPDVVAMYGSAAYVQVVSLKGDASKVVGAKRGDAIAIVFGN